MMQPLNDPSHALSNATLDNWKDRPFSAWTFQNISTLIPVEVIAGSGSSRIPVEIDEGILASSFTIAGRSTAGRDFLKESSTDAFLYLRGGVLVSEYYDNGMSLDSAHMIFSVSKSITGILAGVLTSQGVLDPDAAIASIFTQEISGAYAHSSIRDLLDMTVSLDFEENYESKQGNYARYRRAMLWMGRSVDDKYSDESLEEFVLSLGESDQPHGETFAYRSPNSDLLGLLLEKVSGTPFPQLLSEKLWGPLGCASASITIDSRGMSRAAGGVSCSPHDLALVGELLRNNGTAGQRRILDEAWVSDTLNNGDRKAWNNGEYSAVFPGGAYRNQWYAIGGGRLCAIGIHGQWIYIDPATQSVIVKLSSQPNAEDNELDTATMEFFDIICERGMH